MSREIKASNPFLDDDDVDDSDFLNHPRQGYMLGNNSKQNEWEDRRRQLLEERKQIEERTLQSTNNSIGLLHESEQVGILTAEQLVHQREQLGNIDQNLDFINNTMRTSQKHINSMKSIFGGIKNYFSKGNSTDAALHVPDYTTQPSRTTTKLDEAVDSLRSDTRLSAATHPALRLRDLSCEEVDGFGNESDKRKVHSPPSSKAAMNVEDKLDQNLDYMSMGLGRLKNLAIGLNDEIELQNDMIDRIHNKADKADETMEYQNRQIKRILKK